jgi:hypothetical protein
MLLYSVGMTTYIRERKREWNKFKGKTKKDTILLLCGSVKDF